MLFNNSVNINGPFIHFKWFKNSLQSFNSKVKRIVEVFARDRATHRKLFSVPPHWLKQVKNSIKSVEVT